MTVWVQKNKHGQILKIKHLIPRKCTLQLASRVTCQHPEALQGFYFLNDNGFSICPAEITTLPTYLPTCRPTYPPTHLPICSAEDQTDNLVHPWYLLYHWATLPCATICVSSLQVSNLLFTRLAFWRANLFALFWSQTLLCDQLSINKLS